jgi:hypothetical protein
MVLILFVGCPLHTSETAATRLLPLTFVYLSSLYELRSSGIYHLSTIKTSHSPEFVCDFASRLATLDQHIGPLHLNTGFSSNDLLFQPDFSPDAPHERHKYSNLAEFP